MLHIVYGTNSTDLREPRQIVSFHLSHMAVHHHLHYHRLHLLLLVQSFILNLRLGFSANHFLHRPFPFLPDWFYGLSDHLNCFYSAQRLDLFTWCVYCYTKPALSRFSNALHSLVMMMWCQGSFVDLGVASRVRILVWYHSFPMHSVNLLQFSAVLKHHITTFYTGYLLASLQLPSVPAGTACLV